MRTKLPLLPAVGALAFLFGAFSPPEPAFAQTVHNVRRIDRIQIIEGKPARKFVRLEPVWATDTTMEAAMKKLKRQAARLRADAIIEFKMGTERNEVEGTQVKGDAEDQSIILDIGAINQPQPVVQGWAVKWVEEPGLEI